MSVCFLGIDGCGKTSHALSLSKSLSRLGIHSLYARPDDLLVRCLPLSLIKWTSQHIVSNRKKNGGKSSDSAQGRATDKRFGLIKYPLTLVFLLCAWLTYIVAFRSKMSQYVLIYDRYFYDWIYFLGGKHSNVLMRAVPKPDLIFLLDVGVPEAFSRMHVEADKEFSPVYYFSLREWYLNLALEHGFKVIDSVHDFNETSYTILEHTLSSLKMRKSHVF